MKNSIKYFTFSRKHLHEFYLVGVSVFVSGISIYAINDLLMKQFPLKAELLDTLIPTIYTYTLLMVMILTGFYLLKPKKWYFFALKIIISCIIVYLLNTLINVFWL
ncbi:MAG: hypothetical protein ISR55_09720 [Bacteroidetes bacterium]|nr:hypothetical protein [Bacteroidota bacterium]